MYFLNLRWVLKWTVFSILLFISAIGICSTPEVAKRFFPNLFWSNQLQEIDRAIINITIGYDRAKQAMSFMQMLKDGLINRQAFPYITKIGLEAAINRTEAKQQRLSELNAMYEEKYERLKQLMLHNTKKAQL